MKIVLVEISPDARAMTMDYQPHPGLAYMGACLLQNGHTVCIVDPVSSGNNIKRTIKNVVDFKPRIIGVTSTTAARFRTMDVIDVLKVQTGAFIVVGGPHFHPTAREAMSKMPVIDCIVKGEGEQAIVEIAQAVEDKKSLSGIPGIFYRHGRDIIETPDRDFNTDLDSLPLPAYDLFDLKLYKPFVRTRRGLPALGVISSRGCPCKCIFCSISALKKSNFRKRSPELFVEEVAYLQKTYGYNTFLFNDDTITIDRNHIISICDGIIKRRLNISWSALARVNTVDKELLLQMKRAGCCLVMYGIESGSDAILTTLKKGITIDQAVKAIDITAEVGIPFDALFMVSFPGETRRELHETAKLINRFSSYPDSRAPYGFTTIYPGTELERLAHEQGVLPSNFSWNEKYRNSFYSILGTDPYTPCWEIRDLPLEEIKAIIFKSRSLSYKIQNIFHKIRRLTPNTIFSNVRMGIRVFTVR